MSRYDFDGLAFQLPAGGSARHSVYYDQVADNNAGLLSRMVGHSVFGDLPTPDMRAGFGGFPGDATRAYATEAVEANQPSNKQLALYMRAQSDTRKLDLYSPSFVGTAPAINQVLQSGLAATSPDKLTLITNHTQAARHPQMCLAQVNEWLRSEPIRKKTANSFNWFDMYEDVQHLMLPYGVCITPLTESAKQNYGDVVIAHTVKGSQKCKNYWQIQGEFEVRHGDQLFLICMPVSCSLPAPQFSGFKSPYVTPVAKQPAFNAWQWLPVATSKGGYPDPEMYSPAGTDIQGEVRSFGRVLDVLSDPARDMDSVRRLVLETGATDDPEGIAIQARLGELQVDMSVRC